MSQFKFVVKKDEYGWAVYETKSQPFENGIFSFVERDMTEIQKLVSFLDANVVEAYRELVFDKIKDFRKNCPRAMFSKIGIPKLHSPKEKPLLQLSFFEYIWKVQNAFETSGEVEEEKWLFIFDKYKTLASIFDTDRIKTFPS